MVNEGEDDAPEPIVEGAARGPLIRGLTNTWVQLVIAGVVLALVLGGFYLFTPDRSTQSSQNSGSATKYCETYRATREPLKKLKSTSPTADLKTITAVLAGFDAGILERWKAAPAEIEDDWGVLYDQLVNRHDNERLSMQERGSRAADAVNAYAERYCDLAGDM